MSVAGGGYIYTSPLRSLGKYPILATSTSVNNSYIYISTLIFLKMVQSTQDIFSTGEKKLSACPKLFIYPNKSNLGSEFLVANLILFFFF